MILCRIAFKVASADEQSVAFLCYHALVVISGLILLKSCVTATRGTGRVRDSWVGIGMNSCSCLSAVPGQGVRAASGAAAGQQGAAADRPARVGCRAETSLGTTLLPRARKVCVSKPPQS